MNAIKKVGVGALTLVGGVSAAMAELPAGATTAFTSITADAGDLIDLAWPVAIAITGGIIVLGLFKKFAKKAAS